MEFVEAPAFTRHLHEYLSDEQYRALQESWLQIPNSGR